MYYAIQNNRISYGGISFGLPNGLLLNTNPDSLQENGLEFKPQDDSFFITVRFFNYEETTKEHIIALKSQDEMMNSPLYCANAPDFDEIQQINLNGLNGFAYSCRSKKLNWYEAHFDSVNDDYIHFSIYIETLKREYYRPEDILFRQDVKEFLEGIQVEKAK